MILYNKQENKSIRQKLRKNATEAEKCIWNIIRNKQLRGLKFFRQYNISDYILDFYCPEIRLAIEIDGGQHNKKENILDDKKREEFLHSLDIHTIRFWNNEVLQNIEGVYQKINDIITPLSPLTLRGANVTKQQVIKKLNEIIDPELGISIVELGLIYKVSVKKGEVDILMTFTTPACPLTAIIEKQIKEKILSLPGIEKVFTEFTFNPPWSQDRISDDARAKLGLN